MRHERTGPLAKAAVGARIESVRYHADSGYIVLTLDSGSELWVKAGYEEGYHVFVEGMTGDSVV
jgi:hypothetical protein